LASAGIAAEATARRERIAKSFMIDEDFVELGWVVASGCSTLLEDCEPFLLLIWKVNLMFTNF
jgi:hypothetical protein